jgi:Flp pilus assembly protein TadG
MRVKQCRKKRGGAAMVELAIILPVFILLVLGLIEASRLGMVAQILTTAAREGCRIAVIDGNTNTDVTNSVNQLLSTSKITGATQTLSPTNCTTVHSSDNPNTITVTVSVPYSKVSWLGKPLLFQNVTVTGTATMSSERP